ncbi:MAG: single-stranded DNA-binding protein [Firmicutes bacterium]|jgi:single-strand DNA-binding protein|nr:single-stranded DNA-binding protein [Bacillota bacterium]
MLNQVVLIGRLTHDPELRYTPGNGVAVTTFTIAVDRPYANQQGAREADFIRIVAWRKLAENCANYLKKGLLVAVVGRLQIRSYEDSQGVSKKVAEVVANDVRFLEWARNQEAQSDDLGDLPGDEMIVNEDDIPF